VSLKKYPEGPSYGDFDAILDRRAEGLHAYTFSKNNLTQKKKAYHRIFMQIDENGDPVEGLSKKKGGIVKVNQKSGYKPSDTSRALFGDDRHVRALSGDIVAEYKLVVPIWRKSVQTSSHVAFSESSSRARDNCRTLYNV
jgi:hypothetical protein